MITNFQRKTFQLLTWNSFELICCYNLTPISKQYLWHIYEVVIMVLGYLLTLCLFSVLFKYSECMY